MEIVKLIINTTNVGSTVVYCLPNELEYTVSNYKKNLHQKKDGSLLINSIFENAIITKVGKQLVNGNEYNVLGIHGAYAKVELNGKKMLMSLNGEIQ